MKDPFSKLQFGFGKRVPVILQVEAAECGLACIAMVMGYYGHQIDLATMRRRYSVSFRVSRCAVCHRLPISLASPLVLCG